MSHLSCRVDTFALYQGIKVCRRLTFDFTFSSTAPFTSISTKKTVTGGFIPIVSSICSRHVDSTATQHEFPGLETAIGIKTLSGRKKTPSDATSESFFVPAHYGLNLAVLSDPNWSSVVVISFLLFSFCLVADFADYARQLLKPIVAVRSVAETLQGQ